MLSQQRESTVAEDRAPPKGQAARPHSHGADRRAEVRGDGSGIEGYLRLSDLCLYAAYGRCEALDAVSSARSRHAALATALRVWTKTRWTYNNDKAHCPRLLEPRISFPDYAPWDHTIHRFFAGRPTNMYKLLAVLAIGGVATSTSAKHAWTATTLLLSHSRAMTALTDVQTPCPPSRPSRAELPSSPSRRLSKRVRRRSNPAQQQQPPPQQPPPAPSPPRRQARARAAAASTSNTCSTATRPSARPRASLPSPSSRRATSSTFPAALPSASRARTTASSTARTAGSASRARRSRPPRRGSSGASSRTLSKAAPPKGRR